MNFVFEKTGIKLGQQDFLIGTLEQLADKLTESSVFADEPIVPATPNQSVVEEPLSQSDPGTNSNLTDRLPDQSKSIIKKLKGFWL